MKFEIYLPNEKRCNIGNGKIRRKDCLIGRTPQIVLVSPENNSRQTAGTLINITFVGDNGSFIYNWNGEQNVTRNAGDPITLPTEPGLYQLHIFVYDDAGNVAVAYFEFIVSKKSNDGLLLMLMTLIVTTSVVVGGTVAFIKLKPRVSEKYQKQQSKDMEKTTEETAGDSLEEIASELNDNSFE